MSGRKRNQKKRRQATRRRNGEGPSGSANLGYQKLLSVFGENSEPMLRLASAGATAEEIADRLCVPAEEAERFIERFTQLPCGFDRLLLRAPSLMGKSKALRAVVKGAARTAARRGRFF